MAAGFHDIPSGQLYCETAGAGDPVVFLHGFGLDLRMWLEHPLFAPARALPALASRLLDMVYDYSGWHWINADPGLAPAPPAISRLASVGTRTLVVCGDRDLPDFQHIAATLVAGIPGATRVVIPGAGHMANMEAPAAFNEALLRFLA